jgi:hypothetical protein
MCAMKKALSTLSVDEAARNKQQLFGRRHSATIDCPSIVFSLRSRDQDAV